MSKKTPKFNGSNLFFSSDLHFGHKTMAKHRRYDDTTTMDRRIISNWNTIVKEHDVVFILGDLSFGNNANTMECLLQLNGELHLILGNHDKHLSSAILSVFQTVNQQLEIDVMHETFSKVLKQRLFLNHFSMRIWNRSHFDAMHLFGHSHGALKGIGRSMDVGIDPGMMYPFKFKDIYNKLKDIPRQNLDHHTPKELNNESQ